WRRHRRPVQPERAPHGRLAALAPAGADRAARGRRDPDRVERTALGRAAARERLIVAHAHARLGGRAAAAGTALAQRRALHARPRGSAGGGAAQARRRRHVSTGPAVGRRGAPMRVITHPDRAALVAQTADRLTALLGELIARQGRATVAVTGGSVGIELLAALADRDIDW